MDAQMEAQKEEQRFDWAVDALMDALWDGDNLDLLNLNELAEDLKSDTDNYITQKLRKRLKRRIEQEVEVNNLCPWCFEELEYGGFKRELIGEAGGAPAYQEVHTKMVCTNCTYEYKD